MRRQISYAGAAGWIVAALALLLAGPAAGQGATTTPPERALFKDVRGRVVDADTGVPMAGVPVSLLYEMTLTNEAGEFLFEKVPLKHNAEVSVRIKSRSGFMIGCMTLDVPVAFYPVAATLPADGSQSPPKFGIQIVEPAAEETVEIRLATVASAEVSEVCSGCHENNPCVEALSYEEVLKSGKDLRGIIVMEDELDAFRETMLKQGMQRDTYRKMRYQDTHPDGMNMEAIPKLNLPQYAGRYRYPEGLALHEEKYVNCDTCHTRHVPTEQKQYVLMAYEEQNELCYKCHL